MKPLFIFPTALALSIGLGACSKQGDSKTADDVEEAADETEEAMDDAADETEEAIDDAADETEDEFDD